VGLTFLSAASTQGSLVQSNGFLRWNLGGLANGASLQTEAVFVATNAGAFTQFAGVKAYDLDLQTNNNSSQMTVTVLPAPCVPVPSGLLAWWPGDGTASDLVGNHPGQLLNGASFVPGKGGQAFQFDGGDDYVDTGAWSAGSQWTIEAWVNPTSTPMEGRRRTIVGGCNECRDWAISMISSEFVAVIRQPGGCTMNLGSGVLAVAGRWYHVAFTCDGATARIYVDGGLRNSGPVDANYVGTTAGLRIGGEVCCSGNNFPGFVDEVSLYNRALSGFELQSIYQVGTGCKCKGPVDVRLTIAPTPSGVVLRWPSAAVGWQLQFVDALFPGVLWQKESTPPQLINSAYQLTLPATATQRFYRLKSP
jgi:hypothetical protein